MSKQKLFWLLRGGNPDKTDPASPITDGATAVMADIMKSDDIPVTKPADVVGSTNEKLATIVASVDPADIPLQKIEDVTKAIDNAVKAAEEEEKRATNEGRHEDAKRVEEVVAKSEELVADLKIRKAESDLTEAKKEKEDAESKVVAIEIARGKLDNWEALRLNRVFPAHDLKLAIEEGAAHAGTIFGAIGSFLSESPIVPFPVVIDLETANKIGSKICKYIRERTSNREMTSSVDPHLKTSDLLGYGILTYKLTSSEPPSINKDVIEIVNKSDYANLIKHIADYDMIQYRVAWSPSQVRYLVNPRTSLVLDSVKLDLCDPNITSVDDVSRLIDEMAAKYTDSRLDFGGKTLLLSLFRAENKTLSADAAHAAIRVAAPETPEVPIKDVHPASINAAKTVAVEMPNTSDATTSQDTPRAVLEQPAAVQAGGRRKSKKTRDYAALARKYKAKYLKAKAMKKH